MLQITLSLTEGSQADAALDLSARVNHEEWALVVAFAEAVLARNGKTLTIPVSDLGRRALAQSGDWLDGPAPVRR